MTGHSCPTCHRRLPKPRKIKPEQSGVAYFFRQAFITLAFSAPEWPCLSVDPDWMPRLAFQPTNGDRTMLPAVLTCGVTTEEICGEQVAA